MPGFGKRSWESWIKQPQLPRPWPEHSDRRTCADGTELELNSRTLEFDPLNQTTIREIQVRHYADNAELIAEEAYPIMINIYFKAEIELLLQTAGFVDIAVTGSLEDGPTQPWQDERIVFTARKDNQE